MRVHLEERAVSDVLTGKPGSPKSIELAVEAGATQSWQELMYAAKEVYWGDANEGRKRLGEMTGSEFDQVAVTALTIQTDLVSIQRTILRFCFANPDFARLFAL